MTFWCALVVGMLLFYGGFNVSFKVETELLNFTDNFVGSGLEKRVRDILLDE